MHKVRCLSFHFCKTGVPRKNSKDTELTGSRTPAQVRLFRSLHVPVCALVSGPARVWAPCREVEASSVLCPAP